MVAEDAGERRVHAMSGLVRLGRAREALEVARTQLHSAAAITPLHPDHIATLVEVAEVLALLINEYETAERSIYDYARVAAKKQGEKSAGF